MSFSSPQQIIHREGRVSGQKLSRKAAAAAAAAGLTVVDVNGELKKVTAVAEGEHQVLVRQQLEHEEQGIAADVTNDALSLSALQHPRMLSKILTSQPCR